MQTIFVTWKAVELAQELYSMEAELMTVLPRLRKSAESREVSDILAEMIEEADCHLVRLEEVFAVMNRRKAAVCSSAANRQLAEAVSDNLEMKMLASLRGFIKRKVNAYCSLISLTHLLDKPRATKLIELNLMDEYRWEQQLTDIIVKLGRQVAEELVR